MLFCINENKIKLMIFLYGLCNIISDDLMLKKDKKVKRKL